VKGIDFNSLCSVAGSGEVKMVGRGSVKRLQGVNLRRRCPVVAAAGIDARFTRRKNQNRQPFRDLAIYRREGEIVDHMYMLYAWRIFYRDYK
jgi:hypothetical protein